MSPVLTSYHVLGGKLVKVGRGTDTLPPVENTRPTGPGYVRYEDTYVSGDTLQQTFNRVTGNRVLTFPEGNFTYSDFLNGYFAGIRLGQSGATGCRGIVGSGRGTVFKPIANSSTRDKEGAPIAGTQIECVNIVGGEFANFAIGGTPQNGRGYTGLTLDGCHDAKVDNLYLRGASPGYSNYPPGETFGINVYRSDRVQIADTEVDGRDDAGNRVCASPIGWNSASDARVLRCYVHHGLAGMLTFWQTTNIYTEDIYSYSTGSAGGQLAGACINHEESKGVIRHIRPKLWLYGIFSKEAGATTNSGAGHITMHSVHFDMPDVQVIEPTFDSGPGSGGMFSVEMYANYTDGKGGVMAVTTPPIIIKNGIQLIRSDHPTSGFGDKDRNKYFSIIH